MNEGAGCFHAGKQATKEAAVKSFFERINLQEPAWRDFVEPWFAQGRGGLGNLHGFAPENLTRDGFNAGCCPFCRKKDSLKPLQTPSNA